MPAKSLGLPLLEMRQISKRFGGVAALLDIDLDVRRGEVHALVGANGAGKSTLINVLTGAEQPDSGSICVWRGAEQLEYSALTPTEARACGIAAIHQEFHLLPHLSVAENVFLGKLPTGPRRMVDFRHARRETRALLDALGSDIDPREPVRNLSVAAQQLVEIAKAFAEDASLVLMDEPSAVLGGNSLDAMMAAVRRLRDADKGIVYISHRLDEIYEIADRVTVLRDGRNVATAAVTEVSKRDLIALMVGRPSGVAFPPSLIAPGTTALSVRSLTTANGGVRNVSFEVRKGEILGIGGMGGSGRTRLLRAIFGLERLDAGDVMCGERAVRRSPRRALRAGLALVPEDRKLQGLLLRKSVLMNLTLVVLEGVARARVVSTKRERDLGRSLLARLGIKAKLEQRVDLLSGGNQQKVLLARWLATSPQVLLADEPTRGIDIGTKVEIYRLMRGLTDQGMGVVFVSSEFEELLGLADRILVMRDGEIRGEFRASQTTEEEILAVATGEAP